MAKEKINAVNVIEETKKALAKEETERVFLHEEHYKCKAKTVNINGYLMKVPVGQWTEVPKSVAELLRDRKAVIEQSSKETEVFKKGLGKDMSGSI